MRTLNLALQGGGSHGAFTWGVLDALLDDGRLAIEGLSGTSAGAVNAVALAGGHARGLAAGVDPRERARESLARIWGEISALGTLGAVQQKLASMLWGGAFSPYQSNPLDINPLRSLLEREIDFDAIARLATPQVFVSATHVNSGRATIFSGPRLTAQAVMASACLPMIFQAVEIDGESYWDGGYALNPPLTPLINACAGRDLMLVQINPLLRDQLPRSPADIADRVSELNFNASLLAQMRSIDFVNRLIERGTLGDPRCKHVLLHRIDGGPEMARYPASSRSSADAKIIAQLFDLGRLRAREWLTQNFDAIGRQATVDIRRDYLDSSESEMRHVVPAPAHGVPPVAQEQRGPLARLRRWFAG